MGRSFDRTCGQLNHYNIVGEMKQPSLCENGLALIASRTELAINERLLQCKFQDERSKTQYAKVNSSVAASIAGGVERL
jgi:hypothetical protein